MHDGWCPLHCAAARGLDESVAILLEAKANVNEQTASVWPILVEHRTGLKGTKPTPLLFAISPEYDYHVKTHVVKALLDAGASVQKSAEAGVHPLALAAQKASAPVVQLLLEQGKCDPNEVVSAQVRPDEIQNGA